jgi:hypothetical protein
MCAPEHQVEFDFLDFGAQLRFFERTMVAVPSKNSVLIEPIELELSSI